MSQIPGNDTIQPEESGKATPASYAIGTASSDAKPAITGYRVLNQTELDLVNRIKAAGEELQSLVNAVHALPDRDARCAAIATTHLQTGFMFLTRSVTRPTTFA